MVPGAPQISGKEQTDSGALLLAPGMHPEEASINAHCPCEHSQGSPPKAACGKAAGRLQAGGAAAQAADKALSSCTNSVPGMRGPHEARLYPLLLAPTGTTWNRAGVSRWPEGGGENPALWSESRVQPPPPIRAGRLRQKLMAVPHPADLGSINLTIYTHANQL